MGRRHHRRLHRGTHGRDCGPSGMGLRRVLFTWFVVAIVATALAVGLVVSIATGDRWHDEVQRIERFAAGRFETVWDDQAALNELIESAERDLEVRIGLLDDNGDVLRSLECEHIHRLEVRERGTALICLPPPPAHLPKLAAIIIVVLCVLMALSGALARRLSRPIRRVAQVATAIGEGDLSARVNGVRMRGEVATLARSIDEMAERIEAHVREHKELLAGVSHEMRTPLGHVRLLLELAREGDESAIAELEQEVDEMDALVGELLARSRLEFRNLDPRAIDPAQLLRRALERQGVDVERLHQPEQSIACTGDPTLLARALANLVANAEKHGGGLTAARVELGESEVRFVLEDEGPGFGEEVFAPFVQGVVQGVGQVVGQVVGQGAALPQSGGARHPSLGLGLALTRRIAEAHGGSVRVEQREPIGAAVVMTIALN